MTNTVEVHRPFAPCVYASKLMFIRERKVPLREELLARRQVDPGQELTSRQAWRSSGATLLESSAALREVGAHVEAVARAALAPHYGQAAPWEPYVADSWAVIGARGASHVPHHHGPSPWSGVLYIDVEAALAERTTPRAGCIEFLSPFAASQAFFVPSGAVFQPTDGLMLLFPSPLVHLVHPSESDTLRICIGFDIAVRRGGAS